MFAYGKERPAYIQADDVTAEVELSLFDDMDGPRLLLLHLNPEGTKRRRFTSAVPATDHELKQQNIQKHEGK